MSFFRLWYLAALLALFAVLFSPAPYTETTEFFRHIRTGGDVLERMSLPRTDPYSWSLKGYDWTPREWLGDIFLFGFSKAGDFTFSAGPYAGARCLWGLLVLAGMIAMARFVKNKANDTTKFGLFAGTAVFAIVSENALRTGVGLWGFALLPLVFVLAFSSRSLSALGVFLLSVLWVNLDTGFYVVIFAFFLIMLGALLDASFVEQDRSSTLRKSAFWWSLLFGLSLVAAFVHPAGIEPLISCEKLSFFARHLCGWKTPDFHSSPALALGVVLLVVSSVFSREKFSWQSLLLKVLAVVLLFVSQRYQVFFAFVTAVSVSMSALCVGVECVDNKREKYLGRVIFVCCCACLFVVFSFFPSGGPPRRLSGIVGEIRKLEREKDAEFRLLNDYALGGELIGLGFRVFIDTRTKFFLQEQKRSSGRSVLSDYEKLVFLKPGWQEVMRRWRFDGALLSSESPLTRVVIERMGWRERARFSVGYRRMLGREVSLGIVLLEPPE